MPTARPSPIPSRCRTSSCGSSDRKGGLRCGLELHINPGPGTLIATGLVMTRLLFPSLLFLALHLVVLAMVLVIIVAN